MGVRFERFQTTFFRDTFHHNIWLLGRRIHITFATFVTRNLSFCIPPFDVERLISKASVRKGFIGRRTMKISSATSHNVHKEWVMAPYSTAINIERPLPVTYFKNSPTEPHPTAVALRKPDDSLSFFFCFRRVKVSSPRAFLLPGDLLSFYGMTK